MADRKMRYKLNVNLSVQQMEVDEGGYERYQPGSLEVRESIDMGSMDFLAMMKVLGELHTSVKKITTGVDPVQYLEPAMANGYPRCQGYFVYSDGKWVQCTRTVHGDYVCNFPEI